MAFQQVDSVWADSDPTVPPGNITALAQVIQLPLDQKDLRGKFGEAARARVRAEFSVDWMAGRTMLLYGEILG